MFDRENLTLLSDAALHDPYPVYERMRETGPVFHDEIADAWCVLDCDAVSAVLADPETFTSDHLEERAEPVLGARVLAQMTGEEHDEKKALAMRGLASVAMDGHYLPAVEISVRDLWRSVKSEDRIDFVEAIAGQFSSSVTTRLLGITAPWDTKVLPWNRSVVRFITMLQQTPDEQGKRLADARFFRAFLQRLVEQRRRSPRRDLLTFLARHGTEAGLSDTEIVALALNIFLAAAEPLDKTLSYAVYEAVRMRDREGDVLTQQPDFIRKLLAETLRLHPPVQIIPRITATEATIAGVQVPAKATVYCLIGAAQRDPAVYADPSEFVMDRPENPSRKAFAPSAEHRAFGSGLHFCIGSMLAKRQLESALTATLPQLGGWQLAPEPMVEYGLYTRGPVHLELERKAAR